MVRSRQVIPILMYHKVGSPIRTSGDRHVNVDAGNFKRQMRVLADLGYHARTFAEVAEALSLGLDLGPRNFVVTFDDGYASVGEHARPVLAECGFPATVFIVSRRVGMVNDWDVASGKPSLPLLDWAALRDLIGAGWEIGGHTATHPHLDVLDDRAALEDIAAGKSELERALATTLRTFCYPFGHLNAQSPSLVRAAGFSGACTTRTGLAAPHTDPFLIPRIKVAYSDGPFGLLYRMFVRPGLPNMRPNRRSHRMRPAPLPVLAGTEEAG